MPAIAFPSRVFQAVRSRHSYNGYLRVSEFDFTLPPELIAQYPLAERSASRMLVLDRQEANLQDSHVHQLPQWIRNGDCLVVNNSRVLPARLHGQRVLSAGHTPGGAVELLLLKSVSIHPLRWQALVKPGRKLPCGSMVDTNGVRIRILNREQDATRIIEFPDLDEIALNQLLDNHGNIPLPPYIRRKDNELDRERYQTIYAHNKGSVAAPTAGLHFDKNLLSEIIRKGATLAELTLHVGLGTFQPVKTEQVEDHPMHSEQFDLPLESAETIQNARRVIAVGTTCVRTLEHIALQHAAPLQHTKGSTNIFITPGFQFQAVDAMLTNFHLPRSTLLMLVSAFAGKELVMKAYAHAVERKYRFYSYGDCMLIV